MCVPRSTLAPLPCVPIYEASLPASPPARVFLCVPLLLASLAHASSLCSAYGKPSLVLLLLLLLLLDTVAIQACRSPSLASFLLLLTSFPILSRHPSSHHLHLPFPIPTLSSIDVSLHTETPLQPYIYLLAFLARNTSDDSTPPCFLALCIRQSASSASYRFSLCTVRFQHLHQLNSKSISYSYPLQHFIKPPSPSRLHFLERPAILRTKASSSSPIPQHSPPLFTPFLS